MTEPMKSFADPMAQAEIERLRAKVADLEDQMEHMVSKDWPGLAEILHHCYPEDVFPTLEDNPARDLGPRVVSLLRLLDRERAKVARVEALADQWQHFSMRYQVRMCGADLRQVVADPKETQ